MINHLLLAGLNHKTASVEVREKLAFTLEEGTEFLRQLMKSACDCNATSRFLEGSVVLSTCNRTEIYTSTTDTCTAEMWIKQHLANRACLAPAELEPALYVLQGEAAARHLFTVTAGLDSLVVGENEILGQVRDAWQNAFDSGLVNTLLNVLFRHAVTAGKRVRNESGISHTGKGIASLVVEAAQQRLGNLKNQTALLIGAGKISSLTARALVRAGIRCVLVSNRTFEHAAKLACQLNAEAVRFDALVTRLADADLVISCTAAPHFVLTVDEVRLALTRRHSTGATNKPLLIFDLAIPRDVDPAVRNLPGIELVDMDGLEPLHKSTRQPGPAAMLKAEAIANAGLDKFLTWCEERNRTPIISALKSQADAICDEQLAITLRRIGDITPQQRQAIENLARAITNRLIYAPINLLKAPPPGSDMEAYTTMIEYIFGLGSCPPK